MKILISVVLWTICALPLSARAEQIELTIEKAKELAQKKSLALE